MYEWLPYNGGTLEQVPEGDAERRAWLAERLRARFGALANDVRETLARQYGEEHAANVKTAESIGLSEYGRQPGEDEMKELFPFGEVG